MQRAPGSIWLLLKLHASASRSVLTVSGILLPPAPPPHSWRPPPPPPPRKRLTRRILCTVCRWWVGQGRKRVPARATAAAIRCARCRCPCIPPSPSPPPNGAMCFPHVGGRRAAGAAGCERGCSPPFNLLDECVGVGGWGVGRLARGGEGSQKCGGGRPGGGSSGMRGAEAAWPLAPPTLPHPAPSSWPSHTNRHGNFSCYLFLRG